MINELEHLRAENGLLRADIRLLEAGREKIVAQADVCTFRANKNAEAYNEMKAENAKLRELIDIALDALRKRGICGECKHYTPNHMEGLCADCYNDTAQSPCQREYQSDHWTWQHTDKLKELGILQVE